MFKKILCTQVQSMPTTAELALYGIRELSFEELLQVNGGRLIKDDPRTDKISDVVPSPKKNEESGNSCSGASPVGSSGVSAGSSSDNGTQTGSGKPNESEEKSPTARGGAVITRTAPESSSDDDSYERDDEASCDGTDAGGTIGESSNGGISKNEAGSVVQEKAEQNYAAQKKGGFMSEKKKKIERKLREAFYSVSESATTAVTELKRETARTVDKVSAKASETAENLWKEVTKWHYENRDVKNKNLPSYDGLSINREGWRLEDEWKSKYHQNGIGSPELKFINEDGREAVYTKDFSSDGSYELYTDPRYKGTYNYVTPSTLPSAPDSITDFKGMGNFIADGTKFLVTGSGHFFCDMLPYYALGNER